MKFTLKEWMAIRHHIEVAQRTYKKTLQDLKPSDNECSAYQIYLRMIEESESFINRIDNAML